MMLNAEVTGSGTPLVFLHGYGEDLSLWYKISPSLSNDYKVILIDLPGFGKSEVLKPPFSLEDVAHRIKNFLVSAYNLKEFIVFGHSLGGYITLALKEIYPEIITGFGLINSNAYADTAEKKAVRDKTGEFIAKNGSSLFLNSFVPNLFLPANQQLLAPEVAKVLEMGSDVPKSVLISYMMAMRDRKDRSHLLSESDNILFIGGLHDELIPIATIISQLKLLKPKAHANIFNDVAHMSMIESPTRFETSIRDFIKKIKMN